MTPIHIILLVGAAVAVILGLVALVSPPAFPRALEAATLVLALVVLGMLLGACGTTITAEKSWVWQRRPGPRCEAHIVVDGEVVVDGYAPFPCLPPPEFCEPGRGEPGGPP